MDVTDIIVLLRERAMVGRMEVRDKQLMIMAADALEKQRELFLSGAKELSFIDSYGYELVAIAALEEMFGGKVGMKFSDLKACPFCGHDEFYTTQYVYGSIRCNERFDGEEAHNEELYDYLNSSSYTGRAYCSNCGKYLGNRDTDELSKGAERKGR